MTKLRARGALCREAAGEGADFVAAADVDDRALEDRVYREAIDHGFDLAIVERAAIARKEIVDGCTIFDLLGQACPGQPLVHGASNPVWWRIGCPAAFGRAALRGPSRRWPPIP